MLSMIFNDAACHLQLKNQIISLDGNFGLVRKKTSGLSSEQTIQDNLFLNDTEVDDFVNKTNDSKGDHVRLQNSL